MDRRLEFQGLLEHIMQTAYPANFPDLQSSSKYHVYFQADQNTKLAYPAIMYEWSREDTKRANNDSYSRTRGYQVTVIDRNPDSPIPALIADIRMTRFSAFNRVNGLHHTVYTTYF